MKKMAFAGATGALVLTGALAWSAAAHPTQYEVSVGGSTADQDHLFYALANDTDASGYAINFAVVHNGVTVPMGCAQAEAEGYVHGGTPGDPVATIQSVTRSNTPETFAHSRWKGCEGPGGVFMTVVPQNDWEVHGVDPATSGNGDVIDGYISGPNNTPLEAHVFASSGGPAGTSCNFHVEGYADATFDESTQELTVNQAANGDLSIDVVGGANCLTLIGDGDFASFQGTFTIGDDHSDNAKDEDGVTHFHPILLDPLP